MCVSLPFRSILILTVWTLSAAAAYWLVRGQTPTGVAPGQVVAQEFRVSAVETGRLAAVLLLPGQRVLGGQTVAVLDTSVLEREIAVAEARLRQLGAETYASAAALESDGYQTERSFQTDLGDLSAKLEAAHASRAEQQAELNRLREEIARQRELVQDGLVKRDRVDELELRRAALEESVAQWPARLQALAERREAATERLRQWHSRHSASSAPASREIRVRPLRDRASEQIEALRVLRVRLENAQVRAPADAEVVSVLARPGDVVRAGEPFAVLHAADRRQVMAYVAEWEAASVSPGGHALVRRRNPARQEFETRVERVAETVTQVPARFWVTPMLAQWGREVALELPAGTSLPVGEALDVRFLTGGAR